MTTPPLTIRRHGAIVGTTHTGLEREHNEDRWGVSGDGFTLAVADGMGGHEAGEKASAEAVRAALAATSRNDETLVERAFLGAQRGVAKLARGHGEAIPGTTLVVARFRPDWRRVSIGWSGDSRAYLWQPNVPGKWLHQLTKDHSTGRSTLTRCIGGGCQESTIAEYVRCDLAPGQLLLVCTDGLHGFVPDAMIAGVLSGALGREDAVRKLVGLAFDAGAPDNVTVVLARAP